MKAAIYPGSGKPISIETIADPTPRPGDIVIKVNRCGICGTDLAMTRGALFDYGAGSQFGHEYAGEIVAIGPQVEGFRTGENIAVIPSLACGHCQGCAHGNNTLCTNKPGHAMLGFAEYARIPADVAVKLPRTLSLSDGALIEPLAISLYGVKRSAITPGDNVLVLGAGSVALYTIYWARRRGARRIVAMSRAGRRRDLALAMGADDFIQYGDGEVFEVTEALGGAPNVVFECVGAPGMLAKAIDHVAPLGKIVSLGFCTSPDPLTPALGALKCASLQFVLGYGMDEFRYIAEYMDKGHVDPKTIISNEIRLPDLPSMMSALRCPNNETKVHVLL